MTNEKKRNVGDCLRNYIFLILILSLILPVLNAGSVYVRGYVGTTTVVSKTCTCVSPPSTITTCTLTGFTPANYCSIEGDYYVSATSTCAGTINSVPVSRYVYTIAYGAWEWTDNYQCVGNIRQRQQRRTVCPSTSYEYRWIDYACPSGETCIGSGQCTICGDGIINGIEVCDSNLLDCTINSYAGTQLCNAQCNGWNSCVVTEYFGDGIINGLEECDDGNILDGDGCSSPGEIEEGWSCTGEPSLCSAICGDGIINGIEVCDSNLLDCTINSYAGTQLCNAQCNGWNSCVVTEYFGDGIINGLEECDDGNILDGDGCSSPGEIEEGWSCTGEPSLCSAICGDGLIVGGEVCDDGINNGVYGYCNSDCIAIGEHCGDGIINGPEECDDGGVEDGNGCSISCELETEAYWADRYGNRIGNNIEISANVGSTIKMILNNSGLGMEDFATFEIYEDDILNDEEIRTTDKGNEIHGIFENIGYGIIIVEWTITQEDYDAANELFADYDGFVFRINEQQSNELTIWLEDETFWCSDYGNEDICERCNDYNCYAAKNSVDKKVFEVFPDVWGEIRCGSEIVISPECNYTMECWCSWNSSAIPFCGYEWELIPYNCVNYPTIGYCSYQEDTTDNCDDDFLEYSWIAIWTWGIDNGYNNYDNGPSNNESDYVYDENESKFYYDPDKISERCSEASKTISCPAQVQLSFFTLQSFLASLIILAVIYFAWNLKNKKLKKKRIKQRKKKITT